MVVDTDSMVVRPMQIRCGCVGLVGEHGWLSIMDVVDDGGDSGFIAMVGYSTGNDTFFFRPVTWMTCWRQAGD